MREELGAPQEGPAPELIEAGFAMEVADAPLLHRGLTLADMAHVIAIAGQRLIPPEASRALLRELLAILRTPAADFPYDPRFGDPYNCRERFLTQRLGDTAGWLHAGRPRREAGRLALRILLRRLVLGLAVDLADFVDAAAALAEEHAETLMPDQTYLQQAQPSTFGHYVLAFAYPALREGERLLRAYEQVDRSPGGAGCVNGSRLLIDRDRIAQLLGFGGVLEHTRDAMWQTDGFIDLLATAASLATNLSKLAEDLEIWDSREFNFVELAAPYTRGSILMPQKRNPYALAIVRGTAGVIIGRLTGFLAVVKTPSARTDNLIFAYGEVPRALEMVGRATRLMTGVVSTLRVNRDRMAESLRDGFSQATDLAEYVMQTCGIDYRSAYLVVGAAVRQASREGRRGVDLTGEMLDEAARGQLGRPLGLSGRSLADALDPKQIVLTRVVEGGAAPVVVRQMATSCRATAAAFREDALRRRTAIDAAEDGLVRLAEETAGD